MTDNVSSVNRRIGKRPGVLCLPRSPSTSSTLNFGTSSEQMNVPGFDYQAIAAWREQRWKGAISVARHFASLDHLLGLSFKENTWKRWKVSSISRWSWTNNVWSMKLLWTNVWSLGFTLLAKGRPVAGRRGFAVTVAVSQSNLFLPCPISISAHRSTYTMVLGFDDAMDAVCLSFPEIRFLCPLTWSVWMNYSCSGICRSFLDRSSIC